MTRQRNAIDGFVPRRGGGDLSSRSLSATPKSHTPKPADHGLQPLGTSVAGGADVPLRRNPTVGLTKSDIDESLRGIDTPEEGKKGKGRGRKGPISKKKRIIKWSIIGLLVILLGIGGWLAYKALTASNNIFKGNIFGLVQMQPLKEDENGRSNILVLGTSEDDPGHGGAYLTDSMMVMSIHQKNKTVDMFSIPRDLYVDYGMACNSGYQGKINEYFNCVNDDWTDPKAEEQRLTETRKFVGDIFGLDVQYAVHVNNTVIKEAVDAVGGVDVDIQGSNGAPGILDRNFDWRCNYDCYLVKYDNGVHHLDGEHALFLAMARGDIAPTYGLGNSNFDREKNQQKIIIALKEKAVSTGTLTDVGKVTGLIDALGNNLRTNFETSEIRTLMDVASKVKSEEIKTISLFDGDNSVVKTGNYGGASVVMPSAGVFNYDQIRKFLDQKLTSNPVTREAANVVVLNGSGQAGVAGIEAENLEGKGFIVSEVGNAPEGTYEDVEVYQIGDGKSATKAKLESVFGIKVKTTTPPVPVNGDTNFVVIFGKPHTTTN
jgi:LCP family protein required for cell wall assembly